MSWTGFGIRLMAAGLILCLGQTAPAQQPAVPPVQQPASSPQMQPVPNQLPVVQMPPIHAAVPPASDLAGQPVQAPQINPKDYPHPHYRCKNCLNKWGLGCWAHHDFYGSSSFWSELRFQFGSSRQYFSENCRPGPPPFPLPPGYDVPYGYWR